METTDMTSEQPTTPSKYAGLGAAITAELMIGFWFGVGVLLAVGVADGFYIISLGQLREENKVTSNKVAEQVQQVSTKDTNKVKTGKRLAEHSSRKREELACVKAQKSEGETKLTYYSTGPVVAIRVLGIIGYYVYQYKTPKEAPVNQPKEIPVQQPKKTPDKFDMD